MRKLAQIISYLSLLVTIVPSFLVFFGYISLDMNKNLMLAGTIGWFATAPFWMNKKEEENNTTTSG